MAWTAPGTAVGNTLLTAAFWNTHVRDNMLETAPAKATQAGQIFHATGPNVIAALNAVAYRMPRSNAAANALEYIASLNLRQAPVFVTATTAPGTNPTLADMISQSFTVVGGMVIVIAFANIAETKSTSTQHKFNAGIYRTGVSVSQTAEARAEGFNHVANLPMLSVETPAAGTYTYTVKGGYDAGSTTFVAGFTSMVLIELAP